jgi:hypothetical protein
MSLFDYGLKLWDSAVAITAECKVYLESRGISLTPTAYAGAACNWALEHGKVEANPFAKLPVAGMIQRERAHSTASTLAARAPRQRTTRQISESREQPQCAGHKGNETKRKPGTRRSSEMATAPQEP